MLLRPSRVFVSSSLPLQLLTIVLLSTFGEPTVAQFATRESQQAEAIERILDQPHPDRFHQSLTLKELIGQMAFLGIPIEYHVSAEADIALDTEVTLGLPSLPLRSRMTIALRQHNACFTLQDGRLVIISLDDHDDPQFFVTTIYDCRQFSLERQALVVTIQNMVSPDSWSQTGQGLGEIMALNHGSKRSLIVNNSYSVQQEIRQLLDAFRTRGGRRVLAVRQPEEAAPGNPGTGVTVIRASTPNASRSRYRLGQSPTHSVHRQFVVKP